MNNKKVQQIVSVIFIIGILSWLAYVAFLKPDKGMHIIIEADSVAGLEPDNMVVAQGFKIGVVQSMKLKQDFSGKVIINVLLHEENINIPKDSVIAVITDTELMGSKQIKLVYTASHCLNCLSNYDTIKSQIGSYFDAEMVELEPMMTLIEETYKTLDTAFKSWKNENLGDYDAEMRRTERDIREMIVNFSKASKTAKTLVSKTNESYERISEDAELVMANFRGETLKEIQNNVAKLQSNIQKTDFEKTKKNVDATMAQWSTTYKEIEQTQKIFTNIIKRLEKGQTNSLAQILNDPRFQSEENEGMINLDYAELLKDIRNNPEKYTYLFYKEKK